MTIYFLRPTQTAPALAPSVSSSLKPYFDGTGRADALVGPSRSRLRSFKSFITARKEQEPDPSGLFEKLVTEATRPMLVVVSPDGRWSSRRLRILEQYAAFLGLMHFSDGVIEAEVARYDRSFSLRSDWPDAPLHGYDSSMNLADPFPEGGLNLYLHNSASWNHSHLGHEALVREYHTRSSSLS